MVAYCALALLYSSHDPAMMFNVGYAMFTLILTGIGLNLILIISSMLVELKQEVLKCKKKHVMNRREK